MTLPGTVQKQQGGPVDRGAATGSKAGECLSPDARKAERHAAFKEATRGLHAYRVAVTLSRLTPGSDWRRCTKGFMCAQFADATSGALGRLTCEQIRAAMMKARSS